MSDFYILDTFDPKTGPISLPLSQAPVISLMQMAMSGIKEAEDALIEKGLDMKKILDDALKSVMDERMSSAPDTDTDTEGSE